MKAYLYETHTHSCEVSKCGQMPAAEVVRFYAEAGYSGLVLTDHLSRHTFSHMEGADWDEKIDHFLTGYSAALSESAKHPGFTVLLGAEVRLDGDTDNDYLLYGVSEAFLRNAPGLLQMSFAEMADYVHAQGLLLVQAHPFREDMTIADWRLLDGVEVFNGNPSHESNNAIANAWAERHHLLKTSGSDFHGEWGKSSGGIVTHAPVADNAQWLALLQSGAYSVLQ